MHNINLKLRNYKLFKKFSKTKINILNIKYIVLFNSAKVFQNKNFRTFYVNIIDAKIIIRYLCKVKENFKKYT